MSDADFDRLWDRLREIDPANPIFQEIGADAGQAFSKRRHIIFMHSQSKVQGNEEFLQWAEDHSYSEYLVEDKLDGMSLELQYHEGLLRHAVSRGDGHIGDDLTHNVLRDDLLRDSLLQGAPLQLTEVFSGAVRGEVIMKKSIHLSKYSDKANCRNTVNGIMKRKDGKGVEDAELICYDLRHSSDSADAQLFSREDEKLSWLQAQGFQPVRYRICANPEEVLSYHAAIQEKRGGLDYEIDGLIVKPMLSDFQDSQRPRPERQVAFKFQPEEMETTLRDLKWMRSGHVYSPVGIVDKVQIAGTTVQRAMLVNMDEIERLGLRLQARVIMSKRGDIIPKIERVVSIPEDAQALPAPPAHCDSCGAAIEITATRVSCPNEGCPLRQRHRIDKWILVLGIRGFGRGIVSQLFDCGKLRCISDLYRLKREDILALPRFGEKLADKLLASLATRKNITLEQLIAGFDMTGIGELTAQQLIRAQFITLEQLRKAPVEELAAVDGIGEITAQALHAGLEEHREEMDFILSELNLSTPTMTAGKLHGKTFCFTGSLSSMGRKEAAELVKNAGGRVLAQVGKNLDYLVSKDAAPGGKKMLKAGELGITIVSEEEFLAMLS